tara:strand:- start:421 stop:780 length:360 start_codon:yes stop_codon:yes gene_type:complete
MNTAKTIQFNTGRQYQPEGQLISAVVIAEKEDRILVLMVDHSRDLDYLYELDADNFTQSGIMAKYDESNSDVSSERLERFWNISTEYGSDVYKVRKELERITEQLLHKVIEANPQFFTV